MTTPYSVRNALIRSASAGRQFVLDPGSGGTVIVQHQDLNVLQMDSAGARTLQAAARVPVGTQVLALATVAGVTVNSVVIADGEFVLFAVTLNTSAANTWSVISSSAVVAAGGGSAAGENSINIPIGNNFRAPAALHTNLAATDSAGILGLETGTHPAGNKLNVTVATPSTATFAARDPGVLLPQNYIAGMDLTMRITVTETVAATTANIDLAVTLGGPGAGSDICATAAQSCIGAAATDFNFTITGTTLAPGDILDILPFFVLNDGAATPEYDIIKMELIY